MGSDRPQQMHEAAQNSLTVMIWCAVSQKEIVVLYLFENVNVSR